MWRFRCIGTPQKPGCNKEFSIQDPTGICPHCGSFYIKRIGFYP